MPAIQSLTSNTMKKLLTFLLIITAFMAKAQYTTPGTGVSWNLDSLVLHSGGTVILNNDHYEITSILTLKTGDTLSILDNVTILFHDMSGIESAGVFTVNAPVQAVFDAIDTTSAAAWRGIRLSDGHITHIKNATFRFGGGIRAISGIFSIDGSTLYKNFYRFGSSSDSYASAGAIHISDVASITNCRFISNMRSAIASGSIACRANIRNNYLFGNTTENSNRPQINMGPAGLNDTTFIIGNTVIGNGFAMAGGIAYANLTGGQGSVVIDSNYLELNRYGITLTGTPINGAIRYNTIINNNIQNLPNSGGSGINFTASSPSSVQTASVTGNIISGNLWGITIIGYPNINMGDSAAATFNPGGNIFSNNGNGGLRYDLYNNGPLNQKAMFNKWGVSVQDSVSIDSVVFHLADDATLGRVYFMPSYADPTFYLVTFNVSAASGNIGDAEIQINGLTLHTSADGVATINLPNGSYPFSATLTGYSVEQGVVTVNSANVEVAVFLNTGIENLFSKQITVYPNPVEEWLFIKGAKTNAVEIYSIGGALLKRFDEETEMYNVGSLNAGPYLLKIYSGENVARKLLMKR